MQESPVSRNLLIGSIVFSLFILMLLLIKFKVHHKTQLVFCDVGQGDGTYIRIRNKIDVLIDAGPNGAILGCLGRYMPFYDHTIELAILSHADLDHFGGFIPTLKRYRINTFFLPPQHKKGPLYNQLIKQILENKSAVHIPVAGDTVKILDASLIFYWPTEKFIYDSISYTADESLTKAFPSNLGESNTPSNDFSSIFVFKENRFNVLFSGDIPISILEEVLASSDFDSERGFDLLKVPHHGSKDGLSYQLLQLAEPTLSVISVGRKNRYHHPSNEVLNMFRSLHLSYLRTDEKGDIGFFIN